MKIGFRSEVATASCAVSIQTIQILFIGLAKMARWATQHEDGRAWINSTSYG